jgi:hypothetical protein
MISKAVAQRHHSRRSSRSNPAFISRMLLKLVTFAASIFKLLLTSLRIFPA